MIDHTDMTPWFSAMMRAARPWQRAYIRAVLANKYTLWLGARQEVGKTWTTSALAIMLAGGTRDAGLGIHVPSADVFLCSADQQRSIDMVRRVTRHLDVAASRGLEFRDPKLGSQQRIALKNGRFIQAMTSNPENLQGRTGHVLFDEFSLADDAEALYTQALSVSSRRAGYRVAGATNASAEGAFLSQFWTAPEFEARRRAWHFMQTTINDVYPGTLPPHIQTIQAALSDEAWRRFFLCEFVGADNPLLPASMRDQCGAEDPGAPWHDAARAYRWLSVDVGAGGDSTAVLELSQMNGRVQVDRAHQWWIADTMEQAQRIAAIARYISASIIHVDGQGIGRGLSDALVAMGLPVARLATTAASRAAGADALLALAQQRRISWAWCMGPDERAELARDVGMMSRVDGHTGRCADVTVPRRKIGARVSHCDLGDALLQTLGVVQPSTSSSLSIGRPYPRLIP